MENKYKKYLADIKNEHFLEYSNFKGFARRIDTLQELVEKETPKKVKILDLYVPCCPICNNLLESDLYNKPNYCAYCGQALDWSNDE